MKKFIRELRRREVFRTAGLYVGICWILIEGASVVLPIFGVPEVVLQYLIVAVVVGFPIMLVLAWIYDVSEKGIVVQAEATDTVVMPFGGRKGDFLVIGVLAVALILSVYLHIVGIGEVVEEIEPVSVLIADFDNQTGDPLFDGSLEQALQIGIESASFVSVYERGIAKRVAVQLRDSDVLDSEAAQLVAARDGIELVLAGAIIPNRDKFDLMINAIAPTSGEIIAAVDITSPNKLEILQSVAELAADLREALGDKTVDRKDIEITETYSAMSLEAAREYDAAQRLQYDGKYEQAIDHYRSAIEHDPNFGRAFSGWAVAARSLGRLDEAKTAWEQAIANLGSMTERERLRTQGMYYWGVTQNFQKAIETYETLVEKYPADHVGRNNLAVQYFLALDFESARREGGLALEIYPTNAVARSNYALYAMYSSDFGTAVHEATTVRDSNPKFFKAWLPIAMQALADGEFHAARDAYKNMAATGARGASTASLGLADVELFVGNFSDARDILIDGIASDQASGNNYSMAVKQTALAEALVALGDEAAAIEAVERALTLTGSDSVTVAAALTYVATGQTDKAAQLAEKLSLKLPPQPRAYGAMIDALMDLAADNQVQAIEKLRLGLQLADLWLLRFHLGRAYFEAGYYVEALDEFTAAQDRHGEATAAFLDDLPTYRLISTLPYWQGRAQLELGMNDVAVENLSSFVDYRPAGDPLADDARERLH